MFDPGGTQRRDVTVVGYNRRPAVVASKKAEAAARRG
jgi:hypothetical protein